MAGYGKLSHVSGRIYEKDPNILEKNSKFKEFLIILNLECEDLVIEMFNIF
jgi:hypothetical protein